ncbi:MAG: sterol desaturase/sphingolipid hydroxylase (fatty acid hydroxylase superfamily) [Hyphomicrobiaceae bacterium]|jgi:sterol desaturase/sphingolipid hydroxylase (fatty acid hydroxylase superfamily)
MSETEFQILRGLGFAFAVALAVVLQRLAPHSSIRRNWAGNWGSSWRVNIGLWALNGIVIASVCGACACTVSLWAAERGFGVLNTAALPYWAAIPLTIIALDLVSYCWHRANHTFGFLWRFHQVHHSDVHFTVSTAARFHPGELLLSLPLRLAAVAALGAPVVAVVIFEIVFGVVNLLEHGDINVPKVAEQRLATVFVTPALHRRHHGKQSKELGSNFATIFSVWDRLLETFGDNDSTVRIDTGLPGIANALRMREALALPLKVLSQGATKP